MFVISCFICSIKYFIIWQNIKWELSILSLQHFCKSKISPKLKVFKNLLDLALVYKWLVCKYNQKNQSLK